MQVSNIFQLNDLNIKSFLKIILAIQLAMWSVIGLDVVGLEIPILRQVVGFIYLTFIPGVIILRILKLHKLSTIETFLYTVGLSISFSMFTGLLMNTLYPLIGISKPISTMSLIITISIAVLILCTLSYKIDKDFSSLISIDVKEILSPPVLFLCLFPFLTILGMYLVNFHNNNILLLFLILIIAGMVILVTFDKFIPRKLYPLAIVMIAITLLYQHSLISMYLPPWDIHREYYLCNLVKMNAIWDPTIPNAYNAMLSITMVAPIYSIFLNMDLTWVLKVIYPSLFSFLPLALYHVYQKQTDDKTAFLSCFFFMSLIIFYRDMVELARQEIAELFLVLLILLMIDKKMSKTKRALLSIIFGFSIVVSHYGLSYIYMFCLVSAWLTLLSMNNPTINKLWKTVYSRLGKLTDSITDLRDIELNRTIGINSVLLYVVFVLTWYMYVSSSSAFDTIVNVGDQIASSIFTDFLNPEATPGLNLLICETVSPLHEVTKFLHHATQFFIVVGIFKLVLRRRGMKFYNEYTAFSIITLVILLACITVPYFSGALNTARIYHITLIFLAPFCVIGGVTVFGFMSKIFKLILHKFFNIQSKLRKNNYNYINFQTLLKILSIFFVIFFLFNVGFIYEITGDIPLCGPLSLNRLEKSTEVTTLDHHYTYESDVFGAEWVSRNIKDKNKIYADYIANEMVLQSYGNQSLTYWHAHDLSDKSWYLSGSYIYLRHTNIVKGIIIGRRGTTWNTTDVLPPSGKIDVIYTNGGSEIYYYK